jgi:Protein of unknown function (DUF2891)
MRKAHIKMTQPSPALSVELAVQLARIALNGIAREYPTYPDHVLLDAADVRRTRELHPAFYGCFDWHSAVHSHWLLARLLRLLPTLPKAGPVRSALNDHLTEANLRAEAAYFAQPGRRGFERPYGWTWLLKLAEELLGWDDPDGRRWSAAIEPLARLIAELYLEYLPRLTYPIRSGTHSSTAFGLTFALDYAQASGQALLRDRIVARSLDYYGADRNGPAMWEPGGGDFLSPCLAEADLMRRVLPAADFAGWLAVFLPSLAEGGPPQLLTPAVVSDRSDGQIVHLDGLNLSRAWCMWGIAEVLPPDDRRRSILIDAAERHARAGLIGVGSGDYMGEHWLGSFALYMLGCAPQHEVG